MMTERPTPGTSAFRHSRAWRTAAPAVLVAILTAQTSANGCASQPSGSGQNGEGAEVEFARYDVTESGWLSGTELDACDCRQYDSDNDGEVTKAEFVAGRTGAPASPAGLDNASAPATQPEAPAPYPQQSKELAVGSEVEAYINFDWRPATIVQIGGGPWPDSPIRVTNGQPINGVQAYRWVSPDEIRAPSTPSSGPASGPRVGSYYVLSYGNPGQPPLNLGRLEILPGGRYRYSSGGSTGEGEFSYAPGLVRWRSGPFADYGWSGEFTIERDGRTHKIRLTGSTIATNSLD